MDDSISIPSASVSVPKPLSNKRCAESSSVSSIGDVVRPDAKTRRYDRQLRLWGASGQGGLEEARVLLINPIATGTQSLKNLVLPGIGDFEILSDNLTSPQDIGQNFFLMPDSAGKPLAEETVKYLRELNSSVVGKATVADVEDLLESNPSYFLDFTLIIGANLTASTEAKLSSLLWSASDPSSFTTTHSGAHPDIPLVLVRSSGFMGTVRVQIKEHTIVDTHPTSLASLRIDQPFPALLDYVNSIDFESLDSMDHSNIPFVCILIKALEDWKKSHDGEQPKWSGKQSQKKDFLKTIDQARRHGDEENYAEAMEKAYLACQVTKTPTEISALFSDPACVNVDKNSKPFFLLLATLARFTSSNNDLLPLSSSLPDMKSDTARYVHLQTLYKTQANADLARFKSILDQLLTSDLGLPSHLDAGISESAIEEFVKNAAFLKVVRGRSLLEEREGGGEEEGRGRKDETLLSFLPDPSWNEPYIPPPIVQYIAFRAADIFRAQHARLPGTTPPTNSSLPTSLPTSLLTSATEPPEEESKPTLETDVKEMERIAEVYLGERGWVKAGEKMSDGSPEDGEEEDGLPKSVRDALGEMVRAGGSDLPTTAAFLGGVVAQEAIKLLTDQYVPLNNTTVVDLLRGSTGAYEL